MASEGRGRWFNGTMRGADAGARTPPCAPPTSPTAPHAWSPRCWAPRYTMCSCTNWIKRSRALLISWYGGHSDGAVRDVRLAIASGFTKVN